MSMDADKLDPRWSKIEAVEDSKAELIAKQEREAEQNPKYRLPPVFVSPPISSNLTGWREVPLIRLLSYPFRMLAKLVHRLVKK